MKMAKRALSDGGAMAAVLNAADEVAVAAFLQEKIGFADISDTVIKTYEKMLDARTAYSLESIIEADRSARIIASEYINKS